MCQCLLDVRMNGGGGGKKVGSLNLWKIMWRQTLVMRNESELAF